MEYALIKLKLCAPFPAAITQALGDKFAKHSVILPAATLRPETMYGQTSQCADEEKRDNSSRRTYSGSVSSG